LEHCLLSRVACVSLLPLVSAYISEVWCP
jgi:hypothetical protein